MKRVPGKVGGLPVREKHVRRTDAAHVELRLRVAFENLMKAGDKNDEGQNVNVSELFRNLKGHLSHPGYSKSTQRLCVLPVEFTAKAVEA